MSTYKAVFSDIDGTLLTSEHIVSTATIEAIASLQDKNIPFVIISSRSASCIYPILEKHHFQCPIVACGGAWIEDMNGRILSNEGMSKQTAATVIEFMTEKKFDLAWGIYSGKNWITNDRTDARILHEESVVEVESVEGTVALLPEDAVVNKILCMCNPACILQIEEDLKKAFPILSIVKSSIITMIWKCFTQPVAVSSWGMLLLLFWRHSPERLLLIIIMMEFQWHSKI